MDRPSSKILLVEDEKNVGCTLMERFAKEGFEMVWAKTQAAAIHEI